MSFSRRAREGPADARPVILEQLLEARRRSRGALVDDQRQRRRRKQLPMAPENLPQPSAHAIAHDGVSHAPRNRDAQARPRDGPAGEKEDLDVSPGNTYPGGVALFEFPAFAEAVVPGEGLGDGRDRVHTVSLLRPLRRRAEMMARPDRVRMRTRNPCVRLRRRLLGW